MLFKDLRKNYQVFILDTQSVVVSTGRVLSDVGNPHFDQNYKASYQVVDVNFEVNGKPCIYTFKHDDEVGYSGNLIITTNRDIILREIDMIQSSSEKAIDPQLIKDHETKIERCLAIKAEFDPRIKENQENEKRLSNLESSVNNIGNQVSQLGSMFQEFMKELKGESK